MFIDPKTITLLCILYGRAYNLINKCNACGVTVLPENNPKKKRLVTRKQLFFKHPESLIKLFDNNPSMVLEEV
jgi:hypothetical protein